MPLRLDNARALPTCPQQQTKKPFKPRFKVDHAASPMPETRQPERLAPRATSNRNGGRDHLGILGEIKSVHPGEIVGISNQDAATPVEASEIPDVLFERGLYWASGRSGVVNLVAAHKWFNLAAL